MSDCAHDISLVRLAFCIRDQWDSAALAVLLGKALLITLQLLPSFFSFVSSCSSDEVHSANETPALGTHNCKSAPFVFADSKFDSDDELALMFLSCSAAGMPTSRSVPVSGLS